MNLKFTKVLYIQKVKDKGETQGWEFVYSTSVNNS